MLTVLSILGVLVVLFIAAAVATREGPILADAPVDRADLGLPDGQLQPEDLHAVRFSLAVRGYRMDEVDRVLDRAAAELAQRDQRILELRAAPSAVTSVVHPASIPTVPPADPAPPPADVAVVPVELAPLPESASVEPPSAAPSTGEEATAPPD